MSRFSKNFKQLREAAGLTQEELSKKLGISRSAVGMYEQGKREPDFEDLENIADFFNVNLGFLLGDDNERSDSVTIIIEKARQLDHDEQQRLIMFADMLIKTRFNKGDDKDETT